MYAPLKLSLRNNWVFLDIRAIDDAGGEYNLTNPSLQLGGKIIDNILQLMHDLWNLSSLSLKWVCNPTHNYILNFNFHHLLSEFKIYPKLVPCSQSPTVEIIYHIFNRIIFLKHSSDHAISSSQNFEGFSLSPR